MRYLSYVLFAFVIALTYLFFTYDFVLQNVPIIILLCMLYYTINIYVIINMGKSKKMGYFFALVLSLNYAVCFYTESFLLGVPLLFLITLLYIKKFHFAFKIIVSGVLGVLVIYFLAYKAISPSINIKELNKIYNSDGNIAVIVISVDSGATGMTYKYQSEKKLFGGIIHIIKTLTLNNIYVDVRWLNNNSCLIDDVQYIISFP